MKIFFILILAISTVDVFASEKLIGKSWIHCEMDKEFSQTYITKFQKDGTRIELQIVSDEGDCSNALSLGKVALMVKSNYKIEVQKIIIENTGSYLVYFDEEISKKNNGPAICKIEDWLNSPDDTCIVEAKLDPNFENDKLRKYKARFSFQGEKLFLSDSELKKPLRNLKK